VSNDFDEKINALKRETNYLLTKAQRFVPKPKTTTPKVPINNETKVDNDKSSTSTSETKTTTTSTEGIRFDLSFKMVAVYF
jgi:hypothetical protein